MEMQQPSSTGTASSETQRAYDLIWQRITTLELAPGRPIHEQQLAADLGVSLSAVQGALKLLAHEHLVRITPRYGTYVTRVNLADLEQLSELRVELESLAARLAAERATAIDLAALDAIRKSKTPSLSEEQIAAGPTEAPVRRLFDIDHRFHQAIAAAARNRYLAEALETFFGLSLRLWHMAIPHLDFLDQAVERHLELVDAVRRGEAPAAGEIMRAHVAGFYDDVRSVLCPSISAPGPSGDVAPLSSTEDVEVRRAYDQVREWIIALALSPGAAIKPERLAGELELSPAAVGEALEMLAREGLVGITPPQEHGVYVSAVHLADLDQLSETRIRLEALSARLAAQRATADDLAVLDALTAEQREVPAGDARRLLDLDHKLHQAIARAAAQISPETARRVSTLALSSIVQAVDALKLAPSIRNRIRKVTIVGNCAMHHLLLHYPVDTLAELPFQPYSTASVRFRGELDHNPFADIFPSQAEVALPPLIGGFVGSDALACLVCYGFDRATEPMAAIDLGTNGEVMVTDGTRILAGSTAAGPAFEGVNISCGTRAVDGAITGVQAHPDGSLALTTIGDQPPVGLTGSGLLELVSELRRADVSEPNGRLTTIHPVFGHRLSQDEEGVRRFLITDRGVDRRGLEEGEEGARISLYLTQHDIRELQKAKGAIRATMDTLMDQFGLQPAELRRVILTGSFASQLDTTAIAGLGMIPPVPPAAIEVSANGAGLGAALMLDEAEFSRAERVAAAAVQVDLDLDPGFDRRYVHSLALRPEAGM